MTHSKHETTPIASDSVAESLPHSSTADPRLRYFFEKYEQTRKKYGIAESDQETTFLAIERFVADVIADHQPGIQIREGRHGKLEFLQSPIAKRYYRSMNEYLARYQPGVFYSPLLDLFYESCRELGILAYRFDPLMSIDPFVLMYVDKFNQLLERIREKGSTREFKKKLSSNFGKRFGKFLGLVEYVDALFDRVRSRLIVIRLELKYHPEKAKEMVPGQAQKDLKHLFRNMRSKPSLFDDRVGCIWKMEYGDYGGEHFHLFLFFTNDRMQNDCHRGMAIGEYWEHVITGGRGTYFNCNSPENKNKFDGYGLLAIGRVEYSDDRKRYNLLTLLAYVCKEEQAVRVKPKKTSRSNDRGEMPGESAARRGRPRSIDVPYRDYLKLVS
ncbi:inovirus-type Gp2 protein [uncultured Propionivibrio sp.]|uniref:inovirus-type Gp2 protein n=1 Tax=uncultured Propionivibrio sp. TaxID=426737 RepID=UPI0029BFED84|nr:inovirus-type Gp2 protein [uncultured Propionivibrio sp.]